MGSSIEHFTERCWDNFQGAKSESAILLIDRLLVILVDSVATHFLFLGVFYIRVG